MLPNLLINYYVFKELIFQVIENNTLSETIFV